MTPKEFYNVVVQMRYWQKAYFKEKEFNDAKKLALGKSKQWERAVDMEIERVEAILSGKAAKEPQQQTLQFTEQ